MKNLKLRNMNFSNRVLYLLFTLFIISCQPPKPISPEEIAVIPNPDSVVPGKGYFTFDSNTTFSVLNEDQKRFTLKFLHPFKKLVEWSPKVGIDIDGADITFEKSDTLQVGAYTLTSRTDNIRITASSDEGFYYALKSLKQLLPVEFSSKDMVEEVEWKVPAVTISDSPEFGWRGYMLDVSRHFFDTEDVKKVLDFMADNKLNRFHWHLTDDQGWRVEIKQYPRLTEVGAWRVDYNITDETKSNWWGRPVQTEEDTATYGGFYTQEDIREIVAYAKERYIEIIPEIDMPGHSQAAIAAYPEMGCVDAEPYVATGGVYKNNTFNPGKDITYEFAENMLNEVMDLFPFEYIHIGGDECNKSQWKKDPHAQKKMKEEGLETEGELQSYFIRRMEEIINERGRILIGWDEILEGGLAPNATVMSWRGEQGGIKSATEGHDVIMTPNKYCYIDLKQGHDDHEPNLGYSQLLLSTAYNYHVYPEELNEEEQKHILGIQANMWTESISDWSKLTYMTFPRIYAIAENSWTSESRQNWDDFTRRLYPQMERLEKQGVRFARSAFSPWILHKSLGDKIEISFTTEADVDIYYTLDSSAPTDESILYNKPFTIEESTVVSATGYKNGGRVGHISKKLFPVHKGIEAKINYLEPYSGQKEDFEEQKLIDLQYARLHPGDTSWQAFNGNLDVVLEFEESIEITEVNITALRFTNAGVYLPGSVAVFGSLEGEYFQKLGKRIQREESLEQGRNKHTTQVVFPSTKVKKIRVEAKNPGVIPAGHRHAGADAKMYFDEIVVN